MHYYTIYSLIYYFFISNFIRNIGTRTSGNSSSSSSKSWEYFEINWEYTLSSEIRTDNILAISHRCYTSLHKSLDLCLLYEFSIVLFPCYLTYFHNALKFAWCGQKAYMLFIEVKLKDLFYIINQSQFHLKKIKLMYMITLQRYKRNSWGGRRGVYLWVTEKRQKTRIH